MQIGGDLKKVFYFSHSGKRIMDSFKNRSKRTKNGVFVCGEYEKYAKKELDRYLVMINGGIILKIIYKFFPKMFNKISFRYASILNAIECEAHNELFSAGLKCFIKEGNK